MSTEPTADKTVTDEIVKRYDDFACTCSPKGKRRVGFISQWARAYLGTNGKWSDFHLTRLIVALDKWDIQINDIAVDQWFGVFASTWGDGPKTSFAIQCDTLEDGFDLLLRKAYEHQRWLKNRQNSPISGHNET